MLKTIISLDRNVELLSTREHILRDSGYVVHSASEPEAALKLLADQKSIGLVLMGDLFPQSVTTWLASVLHHVPTLLIIPAAPSGAKPDSTEPVSDTPEAVLAMVQSIFDRERQNEVVTHPVPGAITRYHSGGACSRP